MEKIICQERNKDAHNSAKRIRKNGMVPGVIYGHGSESTLIAVDKREIDKEIIKEGKHAFLNVEINNENHTAFIKELQREAITHDLIHIDLQEVSGDEIVNTEIPVVITGEGALISKGGILQKEKDTVAVKCSVQNIPKSFNIDASSLNVGDLYRVADLEVAEEISFNTDADSIIFAVSYINNKVEEEVEENNSSITSIVNDELNLNKETVE